MTDPTVITAEALRELLNGGPGDIGGDGVGVSWAQVIGKPTTLAGYGITDGTTITHTHALTVSGDVTGAVTLDNTADTLTLVLPNVASPGTFTKVQIDAKGRVTSASTLTVADIPNLTLAKITDAGTAASKNFGISAGEVPVVESGGKLNPAIIPTVTPTQTFVVANQAAMLATGATVGDIAVRTDTSKTYILQSTPATTLSNWVELPSNAPVSSVAGRTGVVVLTAADVGLGNVTNESKATMFTNAALTGTTTGVNWVGKVNGILFTIGLSAPETPATNDIWFDVGTSIVRYWNSSAWVPMGNTDTGGGEGTNRITIAPFLPPASDIYHAMLFQISVPGVEDKLYNCIKMANGTYEWRQVFATDSAVLRSPNGFLWALDVDNGGHLTINRIV